MKRIFSVLLALTMVLSIPMLGTVTAADEAVELVDQLSVIGSYADSTESLAQPDVGSTPSLEIYPSPEGTSTRTVTKFSFLMINLKGYSGQHREDGVDMPLDDNFFTSLETTLDSARENGVMVGIRFRYDDDGHENQEPDWDNLTGMFEDIAENGIIERNADIIAWCEIGTLGAFGEQWGSRYGDWGYSDELIDLYLNILPDEICLLHRQPSKILHWVNAKLGTSYTAADMDTMTADIKANYATVYNNTANYVSGDGKDYSTGNLVMDDLARLGVFNDGYMGTGNDYGTYSDRTAETTFMNGQTNVPYGGEYSGDRVLQIGSGTTLNTVWYPINAIPEMYYTNLSYLHGNPWVEGTTTKTVSYSSSTDANNFKTIYNRALMVLGRGDAVEDAVVTKDSTTGEYTVTYTPLGYDTLPFTASMESAVEKKIGVSLDLSEYYGLDSRKFILDHEGYRFIVRSSLMTGSVVPGDTFEYDIDIENTGFFKINKTRELEMLLVNGDRVISTKIDADVREWDAGVNNLSGSIAVPATIGGGQWQVYLRITPENEDAADDTKFAVKFANAGIYNETLGANLVGAVNVEAEIVEEEEFVQTLPAGVYYDGETSYAADADSISFLESSYTFTEDGHWGFTILFKLEGIAEGSEINLTRWHSDGTPGASNNMSHSFNYFFENNATYTFGKTLTDNGYYMIYCPFYSVSNYQQASVAGTTRYSSFYINHSIKSGNIPADQSTLTSLNDNPAVITPLGFVEGAITSYDITLNVGDTTENFTGTYDFKNTEKAASYNVQFKLGTTVASLTAGYEPEGYIGEDGIPYKFVGWTTQQGMRQGLLDDDMIAMGDIDLYPYYEPDFADNAARLNGLVMPVVNGVDENGVHYAMDAQTLTATVGDGSDWQGNAGFNGYTAVLPAYIEQNGVVYSVVGIADNAFAGCADLETVYIPQQYATIADSAFTGVESRVTLCASELTADGIDYSVIVGDYAEAKGMGFTALTDSDEFVAVFKDVDGAIMQIGVYSDRTVTPEFTGAIAHPDGTEYYCTYEVIGWSASAPYEVDTALTLVGFEGIEHSFTKYTFNGDAACGVDGTKSSTCDHCDAYVTVADEGSALEHSYTWTVTTEPAVGKTGVNTGVCDFCGDTITEDIPALTKGDSNGDELLNIVDLTVIAQYISQHGLSGDFDLSSCNEVNMDLNDDGVIDQLDLNAVAAMIRAQ